MTEYIGPQRKPRSSIGFWTSDAPLTKEEVHEDRLILDALVIPDGVSILRMEVFVHGRLYEWEKIDARTF